MPAGLKVIIADDHPRSRSGLRALLATMPLIQVIAEASNGQEALQLVEARQPDVVVMDVKMPLLDGLEATRQIKLQWPKVKVVILTVYYKHQTEAQAAGADMFLLKGGPIEKLWSALLQVEAA